MWVRRTPHHDPGPVVRGRRRRDRPLAVLGQRRGRRVRARSALGEELLLDVARGREVRGIGLERDRAVRRQDRAADLGDSPPTAPVPVRMRARGRRRGRECGQRQTQYEDRQQSLAHPLLHADPQIAELTRWTKGRTWSSRPSLEDWVQSQSLLRKTVNSANDALNISAIAMTRPQWRAKPGKGTFMP